MTDDGQESYPKKWKAFQVNREFVFSHSDRVCSYCLSDQHIAALMSLTEYLKWPTRWVSDEGAISLPEITLFTSGLEDRLMSGCCDDNLPIQYRYSTAGVLERSLNAGGVWESAPNYDPRVYSPTFPPVPAEEGIDVMCKAADGAAALIKEQVGDQLTDDMTRYQLNQLITDWVKTCIETSNPFIALLTVVSNQIFALVILALRPALTDDVYDKLRCAFHDNMNSDVSFNDTQWASLRSQITSTIAGIAGVFLEHLVYLLGTTGTTNLCRSGAGADDADCDCADHITVYIADTGGTFIGRDGDILEASAVAGGPEGYVLYFQYVAGAYLADVNACGHLSVEEVVTGAIDYAFSAWVDCGTTTQANLGLSPVQTYHANTIIFVSSAPFTVKVSAVA